MANWTKSEKKLLGACKELLVSIITEWSTEADADPMYIDPEDTHSNPRDEEGNPIKASFDVLIHLKNRHMVDDAIAEMWIRLLNQHERNVSTDAAKFLRQIERTELVEKQAYHDAVDTYFKIYRGRKRGRPRGFPGER